MFFCIARSNANLYVHSSLFRHLNTICYRHNIEDFIRAISPFMKSLHNRLPCLYICNYWKNTSSVLHLQRRFTW